MFFLLMKMRLLSARNVTLDTWRRQPLIAISFCLFGLTFFSIAYIGVMLVFKVAAHKSLLDETVYQIFYFLFLFLLAGAVPFVASTLLHSNDYSLLFAAPLPPRAILAAKLLDATVTNSLQFTVIGIPAIVACATALELPLLGWLLLPLLIALFVLLPALFTALGLLLALGALGIRRLRAAITILNAVMATVVCITIVLEAGHLPLKPGAIGETMVALHPGLTAQSPAAHIAPSGWFAAALLGLAGGDPGGLVAVAARIIAILAVVSGLFAACVLLGERLLSAASVAEEHGEGMRVAVTGSAAESRGWHRFFASPVAAIIVKDFKYLWRDSVLLSQLAMPLILFLVPFLLAMQDSTARYREEMFPFAIVMTGVILFMQTSILSLSCIGLEGRSFWIVLCSPNGGYRLLWAKFVMCTLMTVGIGTVLTLFSGAAFGIAPVWIGVQWLLMATCSAALCGLGVGISAALPRFVYENPAHRVSAWALILGFFATVGYLMIAAIVLVFAHLLTIRMEGDPQVAWVYAGGLAIYLGMTAFAVFAPMAVGARRIETYQWEH